MLETSAHVFAYALFMQRVASRDLNYSPIYETNAVVECMTLFVYRRSVLCCFYSNKGLTDCIGYILRWWPIYVHSDCFNM